MNRDRLGRPRANASPYSLSRANRVLLAMACVLLFYFLGTAPAPRAPMAEQPGGGRGNQLYHPAAVAAAASASTPAAAASAPRRTSVSGGGAGGGQVPAVASPGDEGAGSGAGAAQAPPVHARPPVERSACETFTVLKAVKPSGWLQGTGLPGEEKVQKKGTDPALAAVKQQCTGANEVAIPSNVLFPAYFTGACVSKYPFRPSTGAAAITVRVRVAKDCVDLVGKTAGTAAGGAKNKRGRVEVLVNTLHRLELPAQFLSDHAGEAGEAGELTFGPVPVVYHSVAEPSLMVLSRCVVERVEVCEQAPGGGAERDGGGDGEGAGGGVGRLMDEQLAGPADRCHMPDMATDLGVAFDGEDGTPVPTVHAEFTPPCDRMGRPFSRIATDTGALVGNRSMCHKVMAKVGDHREKSLYRKVSPPFLITPEATAAAAGGASSSAATRGGARASRPAIPSRKARTTSQEAEAVVVECLEGEASEKLAGFPDFHLHNQRREPLFEAANKSNDGITIQVIHVDSLSRALVYERLTELVALFRGWNAQSADDADADEALGDDPQQAQRGGRAGLRRQAGGGKRPVRSPARVFDFRQYNIIAGGTHNNVPAFTCGRLGRHCPTTGERWIFTRAREAKYVTSFAAEECSYDKNALATLQVGRE